MRRNERKLNTVVQSKERQHDSSTSGVREQRAENLHAKI
jgi:hypothetical protein